MQHLDEGKQKYDAARSKGKILDQYSNFWDSEKGKKYSDLRKEKAAFSRKLRKLRMNQVSRQKSANNFYKTAQIS
eukprot:Pgem_evm1s15943